MPVLMSAYCTSVA